MPQLPSAEALLVDEEEGSVLRLGSLAELRQEAEKVQREMVRRSVKVKLRDLRGAFLMPVGGR